MVAKKIIHLSIACLLYGTALLAQSGNVPFDSAAEHLQEESFSQEEILDKDEAPPIVLRSISNDTLQHLTNVPKYDYMRYIDSVLRSQNQVEAVSQPMATNNHFFQKSWLRGILWGTAIMALLAIGYQIFWNRRQLFIKNEQVPISDVPLEKTTATQRQLQLQQAIQQKNYRLAVRYLYLDTLALLAQNGHLTILPNQTNHQYFHQLQEGELKEHFAPLMLHFEYIWYGEFLPAEDQFNFIHRAYQQFHAQWL